MNQSTPHEAELFAAALSLPVAERPRFLDQGCGGDSTLRARVEALLQAYVEAGDLLEAAPGGAARDVLATPPPVEKPGTVIGRYKLLQMIGEGGCGVVWMAEQQAPVVRRVALKVIKLGMDTKEVIARFEAERQALALMDHPNIAKVLDGGATDTGRPYFVMELVRGIRITHYCDEQHLSTVDRLKLFIQICHAVQHAHQKGIIHRDLKPSNILVTLQDGVPVPKVIDFGIAKATQGRLTNHTLFTAFEQFIGTPAYMSPEQAQMSSEDVDTRSDIYSLGVLLYELLTGQTPFDAKSLIQAGLDEIRRVIRETEPPRPSTRLSTLTDADRATIAKLRGTAPAQLSTLLRGDLDWIVMRCLEKDRTRRYETATSLTADIAHHLAHEPVAARPPSAAYLFQKLVRRHRLVFATAAAMTAALLLGTVISIWQALRAITAEREARTMTAVAQRQSQTARAARDQAEQLAEDIREHLYVARINAAQQAFEQGDAKRAAELLNALRPASGQADLRGFEWYYLWQLCHSERMTLVGHRADVRSIAFSPDGSILASVGQEPVIRLWSTNNGQPRVSLEGHAGWIGAVSFSPDGRTLASGSADGTVRLWDVATSRSLFTFRDLPADALCVAFSPRGDRLAAGFGDMAPVNGGPLARFASPSSKGKVVIWNVDTHQEVAAFQVQADGVLSFAWSPDGTTLATGSPGREVKIWNAHSGQELAALPRLSGAVFALAFAPDGKKLAAASWDPYRTLAELTLWDAQDWPASPLLSRSIPSALCLAFAPDGRTLATAGKDQIVRLWDATNGNERGSYKGHTMAIRALAISADGHMLASGSSDRTVKLWDLGRNQNYDILHTPLGYAVAFSPAGDQLACGASGRVQVWNVTDNQRLFDLPLGFVGDVALAYSPDGKTLAATGSDGMLCLFDLSTQTLRHRIRAHESNVWRVAFSPDGRTIATGATDKTIKLWNSATAELRATLTGHSERVRALAFTPDGQTLISGSKETNFWDVATGRLKQSWPQSAPVMALSPDGTFLAVRDDKHPGIHVKFFDVRTGRELGHTAAQTSSIYGMTFAPNGRTLATAGWDGTAKLWRVPSAELLLTIPSEMGVNWSADFSRDGRLLAVGSGSSRAGQVALHHAATEADASRPVQSIPAVASPKRETHLADEQDRGAFTPVAR